MTLSHKQIIELNAALRQLEGVNGSPFKFTAKTRYSLAKNLRILTGRSEDIDKARVGMVREIWPDGTVPQKDTPEFETFTRKWEDFLNESEDVPGLMRFGFGEFNLDVNPISITALAVLGPLIIEEDAS